MGQYHLIINLDRQEFLDANDFADGDKLLEMASGQYGVLAALAFLLADGGCRGGGDLHSRHPAYGSWAGCRIVIAGDYGDAGKWLPAGIEGNLRGFARDHFRNVGPDIITAMADEEELLGMLRQRAGFPAGRRLASILAAIPIPPYRHGIRADFYEEEA